MKTCYYCGREITEADDTKYRYENGTRQLLHAACAQNWDNEGRRL